MTHAIDILDRVDKILVLDQGRIIHQGSYEELKDVEYFKRLVENENTNQQNKEEEKTNPKIEANNHKKSKQNYMTKSTEKNSKNMKGTRLNVDENKEQIIINNMSFYRFFTYNKWTLVTLTLGVILVGSSRVLEMLFSYYMLGWVKYISRYSENNPALLMDVIYATSVIIVVSFIAELNHVCFSLSVGIKLFRDMLKRVCHAPVNTYFDVTPTGIILNRFSNDLQITENFLVMINRRNIINSMSLLFSMSFAAYNVIWVLIFIPIMACLSYRLMTKYNLSVKEASRIESISSSPIITHLSETISGASTIRAYDKVHDFEVKQYSMQDKNAAAILVRRGVTGWFSIKITFILTVFILFVCIYCIIIKDSSNSVLIGLMMIYLMDLQNNIFRFFR